MIDCQDWCELHQLTTSYSRALDTRDYELAKAIWAQDPEISYDLSNVGVASDLLSYRSAEDFARDAEVIHKPLLATMHRNSNHWFETNGDSATGRVYVDLFEVRIDDDGPQTVHHIGWYDDTYVREANQWKIKSRHYRTKWSEGNWIGARPLAEQVK